MTLSGLFINLLMDKIVSVLIPLLVDDPLWGCPYRYLIFRNYVLIPLLVDDPLWEEIEELDKFERDAS